LGVRAIARECPRLRLAEKLQTELGWKVVHLQPSAASPPDLCLLRSEHTSVCDRHCRLQCHIAGVVADMEKAMGVSGRWQERVLASYASVKWEEWDVHRRLPSHGDPPIAIQLPFDTVLLVLPGFLNKAEVHELQQAALPGAINYSQPRRQVRNPDGSFTQFNEHHKEAWLCDDYDYRDTRRVAPPRAHTGQPLLPWTRQLLDRAGSLAKAPFNGMMCRWESPGVHLKDGPHTYSTHCGWAADTAIGLLAVGSTRVYHIHGIPWFYGRGRREVVVVNMPLEEGTLMVLGGPLKEKWLYAQPRDEERLPERIQFTLQLHADEEVAKGSSEETLKDWTEDSDGHPSSAKVEDDAVVGLLTCPSKLVTVEGNELEQIGGQTEVAVAPVGARGRWKRRAR